ncbi:protein of unknown function [Paenibacillus algorifonticola]|uniref:SLH domain-containing protein n=1 Tax=Paenibacillus algorifonticola TaxID=684063 RepID=A0A1I2CL40_9BACL|nr:S-layer homology domain-containing protein [Paenibacillus algorifonticola]SFE69057.1 protein of unknown function [Paenibacillus algorifonticola]
MLAHTSKKWFRLASIFPLALSLLGQSFPAATVYGAADTQANANGTASTGKWMAGEYHAHTYQSDDAQQSLKDVLDYAFNNYGMDWMALSDHLRTSSRDDEGNTISGGPIPFSQGIIQYQAPKIKQLQDAGNYQNKIIFSGFEWDMPTYDHVGVGILTDDSGSAEGLKVANQFEYLFTNRAASMFDPADVAAWDAKDSRAYSTSSDARKAISWLETNYANTSYAILNHPSRKTNSSGKTIYSASDIRDFNNAAPDVFFGMEGMPGNQMEPDRGGLNLTNPKNRTYGGADYMVAKLGGVWDALLGEGRRFWNFSNSDSHFEISGNRQYSSGYWPGQYSKNYTWVNGSNMQAVLDGMRSGKSFSVFGDLINALDFHVDGAGSKAEMGGNLQVKQGDDMTLTIRFKSPDKNNNGDAVQVDHVDLISGDVTGKAQPGTDAYSKETNDSAQVVATFTSSDWTTDADGYNVITYHLGAASKSQYFRLRGTNLGMNVDGETSNGEPLIDPKTDIADNETRFTEINKRNYKDLWFYSNPIFVTAEPYSDLQAVNDTAAAIDLGDITAVASDISLPQSGEHGTSITWSSSNHLLIGDDGKLVFRPKNDTVLNLTATVKRGDSSVAKTFYATVKGADNSGALQLQGTMSTADGQSYTSGAWTNQSVTASVYASVFSPLITVSMQLSTDGGVNYESYTDGSKVAVSEEGMHTLLFKATDNLGNEAVLPLAAKIDRTKPVITLKGESTVTLTAGNEYNEQGASASDNFGVTEAVTVTGSVNSSVPGTYTLHYNAKDLAGNAADEVNRTVYVNSRQNDSSNGNGNATPGTPSTESHALPSVEVKLDAKQGAEGSLKDVAAFKIPSGAVSADGKVSVAVVAEQEVQSAGKLQALSQTVEFTSSTGHTFNKPVEITLNYKADELQPGYTAAVYYYNELQKRWIYLGGTVKSDGTVQVSVSHFTKFAVYGYQPVEYKDLRNHWAAQYTDRLIGMNVIQGFEDQSFRPEDTVTRAQFAKMVAAALGLQTSAETTEFADDKEIPAWAKASVAAAVKAGLIHGYKENGAVLFKADQTITRAEMSTIIAGALSMVEQNTANSAGQVQFQDASSIPAWAQPSVNTAVTAGILNGYEDHTFRSGQAASRAEAAAMIYKLLQALNI